MVFDGINVSTVPKSLRSPVILFVTSVSTHTRSHTSVHSASGRLLSRVHWHLTWRLIQGSKNTDVLHVISILQRKEVWKFMPDYIQVGFSENSSKRPERVMFQSYKPSPKVTNPSHSTNKWHIFLIMVLTIWIKTHFISSIVCHDLKCVPWPKYFWYNIQYVLSLT
jgi:hypothetical protein